PARRKHLSPRRGRTGPTLSRHGEPPELRVPRRRHRRHHLHAWCAVQHPRRHPGVLLIRVIGGPMPRKIESPTRIEAAGNKPKLIDEYFGRGKSGHAALSVAHIGSSGGSGALGRRTE